MSRGTSRCNSCRSQTAVWFPSVLKQHTKRQTSLVLAQQCRLLRPHQRKPEYLYYIYYLLYIYISYFLSIVSQVRISTSHKDGDRQRHAVCCTKALHCLHTFTIRQFTQLLVLQHFPFFSTELCVNFFVLLSPPQNKGYIKKFSPYFTGNMQFFY